jgi:hypothetical protein
MKVRSVKHMMVAAALTVVTAIAGMVGQAQAFSFGQNDLVLAIYGNNTEALYNLGDFSTRLGSGATFSLDVSAGLTAAQVGTNPVKYTIFGWDVTLPNGQVHAATTFAPSGVVGPLDLTSQFNPSAAWSGLVTGDPFTGDTIAKSDIRSFSSNINQDGSGKLGGAWPVAMQGELGQFMNIMRGNVEANNFTQVGRVLLGANGLLTLGNPGPNPVPLPAGVVLFGSGLIGLIGVARRSFKRMAA